MAAGGRGQDRGALYAGQRSRHPLPPDGRADRPHAGSNRRGRESSGRRHGDRHRGGRARRARRPYRAARGEFVRHQPALAASELRPNGKLRTGLLSRGNPDGPRRARLVALSYARRFDCRGACQTWRAGVRERRARLFLARRHRGAQARGQHQLNLRALWRHRARNQCADAVWADYPTVVSQLKAGTLRGLVTTSRTRVATLPDVPTLGETGISNYEADIFYGIVAPAKTPPEMLNRLSGFFSSAIKAPDMARKLAEQGLFPVGMCGAEFAAYLRRMVDDYSRIIREANITVK